jgi:hypothetical protein
MYDQVVAMLLPSNSLVFPVKGAFVKSGCWSAATFPFLIRMLGPSKRDAEVWRNEFTQSTPASLRLLTEDFSPTSWLRNPRAKSQVRIVASKTERSVTIVSHPLLITSKSSEPSRSRINNPITLYLP